MRALSGLFAITVVCHLVACGGGGSEEGPPGPLANHFDDMFIADVGAQDNVVNAQRDWSKARFDNSKAESDYNTITTQLEIVRNDQRASKLKVDSAIQNKKSAETSADTNRINQAQKELRSAELTVKAADARIRYYQAYQAYLKIVWRYTQHNMYWKESQYELVKAQTGQKANKAPKGISYDSFPKQEAERSRKAAAAKERMENEKGKAASARDAWIKEQQNADAANGAPANWPDPMAAQQQGQAASSSGSSQ
jgi:hypothetical protein